MFTTSKRLTEKDGQLPSLLSSSDDDMSDVSIDSSSTFDDASDSILGRKRSISPKEKKKKRKKTASERSGGESESEVSSGSRANIFSKSGSDAFECSSTDRDSGDDRPHSTKCSTTDPDSDNGESTKANKSGDEAAAKSCEASKEGDKDKSTVAADEAPGDESDFTPQSQVTISIVQLGYNEDGHIGF